MSQIRTIRSASELRGVFPALFTPLLDDDSRCIQNSIDYEKAKRMIDDLVEAGVSGVVPVGTTGQSATLSHQQHLDFIRFTVEYVDGRIPVIAGAGSNSTRESVEMIQKIQGGLGDLTVLCVTGYYNNPPQEGLYRHYRTLSAETGAKIVVYNVPSRTNSYLEPETIISLAVDPNIIGLKQAVDFKSPGLQREHTLKVIRETTQIDFTVLAGEDDALAAILELGGSGIVSATANIPEAAKTYLEIIRAWESGEKERATLLQEKANHWVKAVFCRKSPIPLATLFHSPVYLPLVPVAATQDGSATRDWLLGMMESDFPSLKKYHL